MRLTLIVLLMAAAVLLMVPAASFVYEAGGPDACARCHEITPQVQAWRGSAHRDVECGSCHGDALTMEAKFHLTNFNRVRTHLWGKIPEKPRLGHDDVLAMQERCRTCHQQEFAQWRNGPHSVTYESLFLDKKHNSERLLMDDCLRCHGMHFEGALKDLVTPVDTKGPWQILRAGLKDAPAIPCLVCHSVHRAGEPLKGHVRKAGISRKEEIARPSLGLFDRRSMAPVELALLPMPQPLDGDRAVKMSPDTRQALCYQCHAPLANRQVRSGDDRTPVGVHEGLSCLACHDKHRGTTRASCANCHPRLSNCGRDVETMDTTFVDKESKHNVHWVKCADCHPRGVPPKRQRQIAD